MSLLFMSDGSYNNVFKKPCMQENTMVKFRFYDPDDDKLGEPVKERPIPEELSKHPVKTLKQEPRAGLVLDWIHELGWRKNPFTMQATPSHAFVIGQDAARQALNLFFIKQRTFGTITADHGLGNTFMLRWVQEELERYPDRFTVCVIDASTSQLSLSKQLAAPYEKLFAKYKGHVPAELAAFLKPKLKKRLVILVDNADLLADLEPLLLVLMKDCGSAVIFAGTKPVLFALDELKVTLAKLHPKEVVALLEKRIAAVGGRGIEPFDAKLVDELWKLSEHNLASFMNYCDETAVKLALKHVELPTEEKPEKEKTGKEKSGKNEAKKSGAKHKDALAEKEFEEKKQERQKSVYDSLIEDLVK